MPSPAPADWDAQDDVDADDFTPLTAAQAAAVMQAQPAISYMRALKVQAALGVLLVLILGLSAQRAVWVPSALAGVLAVLLPQALASWQVAKKAGQQAATWLMQLLLWEAIKVVLTLALLLLAAKLVHPLSWAVLLLAFVVTIKAGWLAILWQAVRQKPHKQ